MISKFDQLCDMVIESAETAIKNSQDKTYYSLSPEYDSSKLTGFDQLVANFLDSKTATADEIVDIIQRNSEHPDDRGPAQEVFRNLVDSNIVVQSVAPDSDEEEKEPDASTLAKEPEVDLKEPIAPPPTEEEEEKDEASAVPPPEEDEGDTFEPAAIAKSRVAAVSPEAEDLEDDDEDYKDDRPVADLVKAEKENNIKKDKQSDGLIRYMYAKQGKSPEDAEAYIASRKAAEQQPVAA